MPKGERKLRRDAEILRIGNMMSNVMFNVKQMSPQTTLNAINQESLGKLQEQWDKAKRDYLDSFKRRKQSTR